MYTVYDNKTVVQTIFGSTRQATSDTPALNGDIGNPQGTAFDLTEKFIYISEQSGGGNIRKLSVDQSLPRSNTGAVGTVLYSVGTVWKGNYY